MTVLRAKITSKGQITLPKPLRESLGLSEGDQVEFTVESPKRASIQKLSVPGASVGALKHLAQSRPLTVEEMDEAVGRFLRQKHLRDQEDE